MVLYSAADDIVFCNVLMAPFLGCKALIGYVKLSSVLCIVMTLYDHYFEVMATSGCP